MNMQAERERQDQAGQLVAQHVLQCQSGLICDILNACYALPSYAQEYKALKYSWDDVENLYDDSMEAVEEFLTRCDAVEAEDWQELTFDDRETLAKEHGFEPEPQEIYEWWLVSSWLFEKLKEEGQPVLETTYGFYWGRTCSGQAIKLDNVIRQIALNWCEHPENVKPDELKQVLAQLLSALNRDQNAEGEADGWFICEEAGALIEEAQNLLKGGSHAEA